MPMNGAVEGSVSSKLTSKPKANFVGIDLSLTSTGLVFLTGDGMVDSFNIKTKPKNGSVTHRIAYIRDQIMNKFDTFSMVEDKPKFVAIEGYAMGIRGGRSFTIGELGGVVKEHFRQRGIDVYIVPPNNLKKFISGKGTGDKDMVRLELYKKYGLELPTNDEVDAAVLALMAHSYHCDQSCNMFDMPSYQRDSLAKCEYLNFQRTRT